MDKQVLDAPATALTVVSYFMTKPTEQYITDTFTVPGFVLDSIKKRRNGPYVVTWRRQ